MFNISVVARWLTTSDAQRSQKEESELAIKMGEQIRHVRQLYDFTRDEFAGKFNINVEYLIAAENGLLSVDDTDHLLKEVEEMVIRS